MLSKSGDHSTADMLVEISILLIISVCTIGGIIWAKKIVDKERKISKVNKFFKHHFQQQVSKYLMSFEVEAFCA